MRCTVSRIVLTLEPPPRVSARWCGVLLGQRRVADLPCGSSCATTRDASDRLLPSHVLRTGTRASLALDASCACAPARSKTSPVSRQCDSLRWAARSPWIRHGGLVVPVVTRANRPSGAPVASPSRVIPLARGATRRSRRDRRHPARVNDAGCFDDPGHLPSDELLRPATPSRAPGSGLPRTRGLATAVSGCRHLFTSLWILADTTDGQAPVHVPRCQRESRFSGPRHRSPTSATCFCDARAHPTSLRSSHASGAFAPLLAGTNRCRLRWPPRCIAAPRACEPRPARLGFHRCVPLAWTRQIVGRSARAKASRALFDDVARALLVALRAPGSPVRLASRFGEPRGASPRPRSHSDAAPRRATPSKGSGCLLPRRNPYASGGWLLRARLDRGPVTPPPWRHCSGARTPF
jgi:hypothetical protein